ncbi:hypothetical protein TIFTF001_025545 [Ficus carica]|uniref:Uncharacterized protein n=1 Tax=Ficus carica TaxID=3494 RepID=A0AA88AWZ1_FICCA|nr:hypothetical protein TIFTF001_025545 [Ficus carica]
MVVSDSFRAIFGVVSDARRQNRLLEKNQLCRTVAAHSGGPPSVAWVATLSLRFVSSSFRLWISWVLVTLASLGQIRVVPGWRW